MTTSTRDKEPPSKKAATDRQGQRLQLERALYRRMRRQLRASLDRLSLDELMEAVAAETPTETVARVLAHAPEVGLTGGGNWANAVLRGARQKQQMLQRAGVLTSGEVGKMLGISIPGVKQRVRRRQLLAVPLSSGEWGFPARQFNADGEVREGLVDVLEAFADESPWVILSILVGPDPVTDEGMAFDVLSEPRSRTALLELARSYGTQGAA